MSAITLELMEIFVTIARTGSLTSAANSMHVTASALSHRVRQLEQRLGTPVFIRGPSGVTLTATGKRLFDAIDTPLSNVDRALHRFYRGSNHLTLSTTSSFANGWLVPRLPRFVARYPQVGINLETDGLLVDFEHQAVDAALRIGRGGWPKVRSEYLYKEWVRPVASPKLIERIRGLEIGDLSQAPLLHDQYNLWAAWFERYGDTPSEQFVASFDDSEALVQAAVLGLGVALCRLTLARPLIRAGRLAALTKRRMKTGYGYYLVFPSRSYEHPGFLAFRDWVYEEIRRIPPPLS